jgi:stress response protein YsnF
MSLARAAKEACMERDEERARRRDPEQREDLRDEDELRVQRTEEELRAGTREREAGEVGVHKSVRTEREQVRVPKRREEVHVDRVPVEDREASEAEIGEDEVSVPVTEEEVIDGAAVPEHFSLET